MLSMSHITQQFIIATLTIKSYYTFCGLIFKSSTAQQQLMSTDTITRKSCRSKIEQGVTLLKACTHSNYLKRPPAECFLQYGLPPFATKLWPSRFTWHVCMNTTKQSCQLRCHINYTVSDCKIYILISLSLWMTILMTELWIMFTENNVVKGVSECV